MAAAGTALNLPSLHNQVSPSEWEARVDLAAMFRLAHMQGWCEDTANHISARVPDESDHFLINPWGLFFEEITASSLLKIDMDGNVISDSPFEYHTGGHAIHSGVYLKRPDVVSVFHTHSRTGVAISMLKDGLKTLSIGAVRFHKRLAYHDFAGPAGIMDDRERIGTDLGPHQAMVLRNHGLLTAGRSIGEAFIVMARLEQAISAQLLAAGTGDELTYPPMDVCDESAVNRDKKNDRHNDEAWQAWKRRADRLDPSYRD
jgi:ribulose-5-phosphate 4-epimerase/fuculose-1-phosphate aldolase